MYHGPPEIDPAAIEYDAQKDVLGSGKFGTVYAGVLHSCNVAVKVPKKQDLSQRELEKFRREVNIMRGLNHPNVCLFMGACTTPGRISIVSERLSSDLEHVLKSKEKLSLSRRLKWALDAATGMAWLHKSDPVVLHRDLKTSNLLMTSNDVVKVCDFGLSQFQTDGEGMRDSTPKGTPLYMAPEVIMRGEITRKVDVYAFGIVLWEILTRTEAFPHHNDLRRFATAICRRDERPPIPEGTPASLAALMQECWHPQADQRPYFDEIVQRLKCIIEECEQLEAQMLIERHVRDENGARLWGCHFLSRTCVPWAEFAMAFCDAVGIHPPREEEVSDPSLAPQWINALNAVLTNDANEVTLEQWGKVCGWFGPLECPSVADGFIDRLTFTLSHMSFHGPLPTDSAERMLLQHPHGPGSYLFRFSRRAKNSFALSRVNAEGSVDHYLIPRENGVLHFDDGLFDSLIEIESEKAAAWFLREPVVCVTYQWIFAGANDSAYRNQGGYRNEGSRMQVE